MSVLSLFPLPRKIQTMNGKKRTLESMSARQKMAKPPGRLTVQKGLQYLPKHPGYERLGRR